MNRNQRRAAESAARKMPPARADGRPLYFDVSPNDRVQCFHCLREGITQQYTLREGFMNDPANSPLKDGAVYTVCIGHLPDDAVIFNPADKTCRNKTGDNVWSEGD